MSILILNNPTFQLALMTNELPCLCVCVREREREKRGCYAYTHYRSHHFLHTWSYIQYILHQHCPICACFNPYDSNTTSMWIKVTTLLVHGGQQLEQKYVTDLAGQQYQAGLGMFIRHSSLSFANHYRK